MSRITLSNGETATIRFEYEYDGINRTLIKMATRDRAIYKDILESLKILGELSEGSKQPALIEWVEDQIKASVAVIGDARSRPSKTKVQFQYKDIIIETFSSISHEDARAYLHSKKIGRDAAVRNLLDRIALKARMYTEWSDMFPKELRKELAAKLLSIKNRSICNDKL